MITVSAKRRNFVKLHVIFLMQFMLINITSKIATFLEDVYVSYDA